jgi:hypothetical protein
MLREEIREWILSEDSNKLARGWSPKTDAFSYETDGFLIYLPIDSQNYVMEYVGANTKELNEIVDFAHAELLGTEEKFDTSDYFNAKLEHYEADLQSHGYHWCGSDVKRMGYISMYGRDELVVCIVGDETTLEVNVHSFQNMEAFQEWFSYTEQFHSQ